MSLAYWLGALSRIAANIAADFVARDTERFAFATGLLRSGIAFDTRPRANSRHFLDLYPAAEAFSLSLGEFHYTRSNATPLEIYCLACIACLTEPSRIFEFGTFDGATTRHLALARTGARYLWHSTRAVFLREKGSERNWALTIKALVDFFRGNL